MSDVGHAARPEQGKNCERFAARHGAVHASASALLREAKRSIGEPTDSEGKNRGECRWLELGTARHTIRTEVATGLGQGRRRHRWRRQELALRAIRRASRCRPRVG
jgi:hypothetical protein